ncbi:FAD-dependent oxidoreductase [Agrobacterium rhizogenes]|nr:FAD-dependent oxidoreductase [Rhizobium rhizogenes]NTJ78593.1 FAD-dependent oxidoreductase [Rhizobium rhizogenes]
MGHVVIVGAGFGGLETARRLAGAPVRITVIDRRNYHLFQPLLYQVASAFVAPPDLETHHVLIRDEVPLQFDYLVLATGADHSYFRHDEWEPHAPVNLREAKLECVVTFRAISYQNSMDRGRQRTGTDR